MSNGFKSLFATYSASAECLRWLYKQRMLVTWSTHTHNQKLGLNIKLLSRKYCSINFQGKIRVSIINHNDIVSDNPDEIATAAEEEEPTGNATADPPMTQHLTETTQEGDNVKLNEMINNIKQKFETLMEMSFEQRPRIPKIKKNQSIEVLRLANEAIQNITAEMTRPLNLTEINQLIYATASTIAHSGRET